MTTPRDRLSILSHNDLVDLAEKLIVAASRVSLTTYRARCCPGGTGVCPRCAAVWELEHVIADAQIGINDVCLLAQESERKIADAAGEVGPSNCQLETTG